MPTISSENGPPRNFIDMYNPHTDKILGISLNTVELLESYLPITKLNIYFDILNKTFKNPSVLYFL